jgi:hypothetical protein
MTQEELEIYAEEYIEKLDGCIRYIIRHPVILHSLNKNDVVWADEMTFTNDIIIFTKKNQIQYTCSKQTTIEVHDKDYLKREWILQYTKGIKAMNEIEKRKTKNIFKKIFRCL